MSTLSAPAPGLSIGTSEADVERRRRLRRMRVVATSFLVVAAIIFVLTRDQDGFLGYVHAGAEAGMVGAIADWFAVTALFKHPLGLPIPHTAIIPRRKESLGASLQEFVTENFLREDVVREWTFTAPSLLELGHGSRPPRTPNRARIARRGVGAREVEPIRIGRMLVVDDGR